MKLIAEPTTENHLDKALERVITQYVGKKNFTALIKVHMRRLQDLEDTAYAIQTQRSLDTEYGSHATGMHLDHIGEIVDRPRPPGMPDQEYFALLLVAVFRNTSRGEPERIMAAAKLLTNSRKIEFLNHGFGVMSVGISRDIATQSLVNLIYTELAGIVSAGTRIQDIYFFEENQSFVLYDCWERSNPNEIVKDGRGLANQLAPEPGSEGTLATIKRRD